MMTEAEIGVDNPFLRAIARVKTEYFETTSATQARKRVVTMFDVGALGGNGDIRFLLGPTRSGKSYMLQHLLAEKRFKEYWTPTGTIRPILYLETPQESTVKALAVQTLLTQNAPHAAKGTLYEKMPRILHFLKEQHTKLVIFDEAQMLSRADLYSAADWFKSLSNQAKIPMVIAGLSDLDALRTFNPQLQHRVKSTITMGAIDWHTEQGNEGFYRLLKSYQLLLKDCGVKTAGFRLTDEAIATRLYAISLGLIGIVAIFLSEALEIALMDEDDELRLPHLRQAAAGRTKKSSFNPFETDPLAKPDPTNKSISLPLPADKDLKLLPAPSNLGSEVGKKPGRGRKAGQKTTLALPAPGEKHEEI